MHQQPPAWRDGNRGEAQARDTQPARIPVLARSTALNAGGASTAHEVAASPHTVPTGIACRPDLALLRLRPVPDHRRAPRRGSFCRGGQVRAIGLSPRAPASGSTLMKRQCRPTTYQTIKLVQSEAAFKSNGGSVVPQFEPRLSTLLGPLIGPAVTTRVGRRTNPLRGRGAPGEVESSSAALALY